MPLGVRHYERALDVVADDDPERPYLLTDLAGALLEAGRFADADAALAEAVPRLSAVGDEHGAAAAANRRWYSQWLRGHPMKDGDDPLPPADRQPTPALMEAYEDDAGRAVHAGRNAHALASANKALDICRLLGMPLNTTALGYRGFARCSLGDAEGLDDLRLAIQEATEQGAAHAQCAAASNLGECLTLFQGPAAATALHREALTIARRRHDDLAECFCREVLLVDHAWAGRWKRVRSEIQEVVDLLESNDDQWDLLVARATAAHVLAWSGDLDEAAEHALWAEENSRTSPLLPARQACLIAAATVREGEGDKDEALHLLRDCARLAGESHGVDAALRMPEAIRIASESGRARPGAAARRRSSRLPTLRRGDASTARRPAAGRAA